MQEDLNFREQMFLKNRGASNNGISNPLPTSDFYISEGDRLFGDNFATGEYYRRKQENEKKKERYKIRQQEQMERERRRWERIDYEYLRKENQNMVNKEKNLVGRKNNPGMAFNPLNLQYDNSVQGEILKRRDEESKYRAWMRSLNIDKHSNAGYNIINGEERTILEERLNKDIVPDLIQKNMQQINEMKNKVFNNNRNFFTSVNRNNSPQTGQYRVFVFFCRANLFFFFAGTNVFFRMGSFIGVGFSSNFCILSSSNSSISSKKLFIFFPILFIFPALISLFSFSLSLVLLDNPKLLLFPLFIALIPSLLFVPLFILLLVNLYA